ncbi:MAG: flagellin, partial [Selenomonadaceae bacterium]|nr:flagellin [Selenomonadaceae bacterium]
MAMVVKNNMSALTTLNTLNKNTNALSKSLQKVSSGMKINSAADDASGYAISERMRVQIRSLDQANSNAQNGGSMMKVAEGAVSSTVEILKTLKEKAVNAANDTNTDADRATIQKEMDQSIDQINDNANVTFNGQYLVDGSKNKKTNQTTTLMTNQSLSTDTNKDMALTELSARNGDGLNIHSTDTVTISSASGGIAGQIAGFTMYITDNKGNVNKSANAALDAFDESLRAQNKSEDNSIVMQIGTKAGQSINVGLTDMKAIALGLQGDDGQTLSIGNQEKANAAINVLDSAIAKALDQQTTIGAIESRLEYTQSNLTTASENVTAAESTIRDADMAK